MNADVILPNQLNMFSKFKASYSETGRAPSSLNEDLLAKIEPYAHGFTELVREFGGVSFDNGVYRLHSVQNILAWTKTVESALPDYRGRTICFGFDWLGRHFALDKGKLTADQMNVLLLDPGTGEALNIPVTFADFHNIELVEYRNDVLASDFYSDWIKNGGSPPKHDQCIGYKVPLFLNGDDIVDNLESSDMDVYWNISGQLLSGNKAV